VTPEIVAVRIAATGKLAKPIDHSFASPAATEPKGRRKVFAEGCWHEAMVVERAKLAANQTVAGPLIIEEEHATHFIPPAWELTTAPTGDLVATKRLGGAETS
jgi:N-methylhydantoinase A